MATEMSCGFGPPPDRNADCTSHRGELMGKEMIKSAMLAAAVLLAVTF
jgi:hypothetical protein